MLKKRHITRNLVALCLGVIFLITFFYFSTHAVLAQYGEDQLSNINLPRLELMASIFRIINYVLGFLALIALVLVIYAGFLWMTAGGDSAKVDKAKKILINALIGLVIIICSGAITLYVFDVLQKKITDYNNGGGEEPPINPYYPPVLPDNIFSISSITTSCGDGQTYNQDVFLCSAVMINFNHFLNNDSVKTAVDNNKLKIEECNDSNCTQATTPADSAIYPAPYSDTIPTTGSGWSASGRSIVFVHKKLFNKNQYYRLLIPKTITDLNKLALDPNSGCGSGLNNVPGCVSAGTYYAWIFQTGEKMDTIKPTITSAYPVFSGQNYPDRNVNLKPILWVKFSEPIMPVTDQNVKLIKITGQVKADGTGGTLDSEVNLNVATNKSGTGIEIDDLLLEPFTWYEITIKDIRDLCNNSLASNKTWRFQTNNTAPGIRSVYPANNYEYACPDTSISVVFNTSMYNSKTGRCEVGVSYVTEGKLDPPVNGRIFTIAANDNLPPSTNNSTPDPNQYCHVYEFVPTTVSLTPGTAYTANVKTSLVMNNNGDKLSGSWKFSVKKADACANAPFITKISPTSGPAGTCLTVFGNYFDPDKNGQGSGDKLTLAGNDLTILTNGWHDTYLTTTIPSPTTLALDKDYDLQVSINRGSTFGILKSNPYNFYLTSGPAATGPCLSNLEPNQGCYEESIIASGQRFISGDVLDQPKLLFTPAVFANTDSYTSNSLRAKVPKLSTNVSDGEVRVVNSKGESNPLYFDLMCGDGFKCFDDLNLCAAGNNKCLTGSDCILKNNQCLCEKSPVGKPCSSSNTQCMPDDKNCNNDPINYLCNITTCQCERRSVTSNPNPTVTYYWPKSCSDACLNITAGAKFNLPMEEASLLAKDNILLYACTESTCAADKLTISNLPVKIEYTSDDTTKLYQVTITPDANLTAKSFYRVIIKNTVKAANGKNLTGLNYKIGAGATNNAFSWTFGTGNQECLPTGVDLSPIDKTITTLNPVSYQAQVLGGKQTSCGTTPLNPYKYNWDWDSDTVVVATVLKGYNKQCTSANECSSNLRDVLYEDKITQSPNPPANCLVDPSRPPTINGETHIWHCKITAGCFNGFCTGRNPKNIATPLDNGKTLIRAKLTDYPYSDYSSLTVNAPRTPPVLPIAILSSSPTGTNLMCTNLAGSILFNQPLNTSSLTNNLQVAREVAGGTEPNPPSSCDPLGVRTESGKKYWFCKINFSFRTTLKKDGEEQCTHKDGCTFVQIIPSQPWLKDNTYEITVKGGATGVKGSNDSLLAKEASWQFKFNAKAALCRIDHIAIAPNKYLFTKKDETNDFLARPLTKENLELAPFSQIYDWSYAWTKTDEKNIINLSTPATESKITATANNQNGKAVLKLEIKILNDIVGNTKDKIYTAFADIENNLCLNPWTYQDDANYSHFSLFYCQDRGLDTKTCLGGTKNGETCKNDGECPPSGSGKCLDQDNLPTLKNPPVVKNNVCYGTTTGTQQSCVDGTCPNGGVCVLKEYLFLRDDDSTDAIGLRIFANPDHLSARNWYYNQPFLQKGNGQSIKVDRYEAVKDGRSIYVSAANLNGSNLYTNIFLMSYNENSSSDTQEIFQRLIENWRFNTNPEFTDLQICNKTTTKTCTKDSDCPTGETCNALKTKLIRDTKRLTDLSNLANVLSKYHDVNGYYPKLLAGSYEIGRSNSKWPSWNATLGSELGTAMPLDPLNEFNISKDKPCTFDKDCSSKKCFNGYCQCGSNADCQNTNYPQCYNNNCINIPLGYDLESCWNDVTKDFICPAGSHIYKYQTDDGGTNYKIYGKMEYNGTGTWKNGDFGECANFLLTQ